MNMFDISLHETNRLDEEDAFSYPLVAYKPQSWAPKVSLEFTVFNNDDSSSKTDYRSEAGAAQSQFYSAVKD